MIYAINHDLNICYSTVRLILKSEFRNYLIGKLLMSLEIVKNSKKYLNTFP